MNETIAHAENMAEYQCPICGERATLHCAGCDGIYCAEHVVRGFAFGYAFICVTCSTAMEEGATEAAPG